MANTVGCLDLAWGNDKLDTKLAKKLHPNLSVLTCYLSPDTTGKNASSATLVHWLVEGYGIEFNWEWSAGRALLGAAAGKADATRAVAQLKAHLIYIEAHYGKLAKQTRVSIKFSVDRDIDTLAVRTVKRLFAGAPKQSKVHPDRSYDGVGATTSQMLAVAAYMRAAKTVCRAAGVTMSGAPHVTGFGIGPYAEYDVCVALFHMSLADDLWQTYAWSGGKFFPSVGLYQFSNSHKVGNVSVDYDQVINPKWLGALWPHGKDPNYVAPPPPVKPKPKPVPVPAPEPEDEDDDVNRLALIKVPSGLFYLVDGINVRPIPTVEVPTIQRWLTGLKGDATIHEEDHEISWYGYYVPSTVKAAITRANNEASKEQ